jgi:hypothetical protein
VDENYREIRSFRDLRCWKEARTFFNDLSESLVEEASSPSREVLARDLYEEASGLVRILAGSFSRTDTGRFKKGLAEALEGCRRIQGLLVVADDLDMVQGKRRVEDLSRQVDLLSSAMRDTFKYLVNVEIKKQYKELDDL